MATGLVIHISSGEDRHTEILSDDNIRIGACETCDLRLRASSLPKSAANTVLLELSRKNGGAYRVTDFDPAVSLTQNGKPVDPGNEIRDGDEFRVPDSEVVLHFFPVRDLPAVVPQAPRGTHVAPFIEAAAIESAATARRDDAKVFLREFTRELVREINTSTKLITLAIAVVLVGGMLYLGFAMYKEIQRNRRLTDQLSAKVGQMGDQVTKTNEQITNIDESTKQLQNSLSLAVKLRSEYGSGVCLIAGSFYFVEAGTGRPLRYAEAQLNDNGATVQSGAPEALTPEGNTAIAEYEFVGTGFHVGQGFVMTNRHIAQPWIADDRAQSIGGSLKAQPRLRRLIAYFPGFSQAIQLEFKAASQKDDLAVCSLMLPEIPQTIPVLPLETDPDAVAVGKTVVMMGYPSGPDRLLALLDDAESRGIQQRYGTPMAQLAYLAETKRIQPLKTQGSISDLDVRRIVYDARTAEGGSGAPLFGPSGRVIGVNFAVFTENQASNFAVPIRFGIPLLERSGWEAPAKETKDGETATQTHPEKSGSR